MSYNGSGTFTINSTGQPVVAGTVITASAFNALTTDLATGLTTAITKDGQTTTTARITFAQGITSSLVTDSSSVSTGSIITAGGAGIAKNLYVGGALDVAGATTFTNPTINNIKMGYTTTATAAGTTTLTISSNYRQFFTGTLAQTIVLPVTSTLVTGMAYEIENNSTGLLTVNSSGGNLVGTIPAGVCAHAVCIGTTLTTAADWDWDYISNTTITGTGSAVLGTSPTITTATLASPNITTALTLTGSAGTAGQALTSGGSGVAPTWSTVSSDTVGFKNRIFNGQMVIDQRNAGASLAITTTGQYSVDRFQGGVYGSGTGRFSLQQSSTVPAGFTNSLLATVTTADASPSASYGYAITQPIEGYNIADLGWGTANAQSATLSFWVRSSVTGTFPVVFQNNAADKAYGGQYTISSANTWEQKSIVVSGVTSGTWLTTNGAGIYVNFGLGGGSNRTMSSGLQTIGGALTTMNVTGSTQLIATNGATFYITGVQLEKGSTATSFDYRPYGTELLLCQRYYETTAYPDVTFTAGATRSGLVFGGGGANSSGFSFLVPKRTNSPTVTLYSRNNTSGAASLLATGADITGSTANGICGTGFRCTQLGSSQSSVVGIETGWTVSAEL
jgi:hypothetical protein